jgi:L-threonylcarbamoyladenylate synthase
MPKGQRAPKPAKRLELELSSGLQDEGFELAVACLVSGGILLYPSDTVYGLCCRADRPGPPERLRDLKGYGGLPPGERPLIVLVGTLDQAMRLGRVEGLEVARRLMEAHWPGPLTMVLEALDSCPEWLRSAEGTVALRMPADPLSSGLLRLCGFPLVSTSANMAGEDPPLCPDGVPEAIVEGCCLVLDAGQLPPRLPSTIVKPLEDGYSVLRQGELLP